MDLGNAFDYSNELAKKIKRITFHRFLFDLKMIEAHFLGLSSQSSIYGLTSLSTGAGSHKVLMATLKRKVHCVEYSQNYKHLIPSTREVQFTYIPGGAEIISIDAFNQACHEHDFVVGITFVKCDSSGNHSQYFNIYSDWEPSSECDLDNIAQGCLSLGLDFIPFQLTHTELSVKGKKEMVWLLSGSDCKVHLYREDKSHQSFCEESGLEHFPEFENLHSVVVWMDFITNQNSRLTAVGCSDGSVQITSLSLNPDIKIVSSWSVQHDGPISVVKLFHDTELIPLPFLLEPNESLDAVEGIPVHLLVGNTLEVSVVYRDVRKKGLSLGSQWLLPNSNKYDCITCACVADIDMDGHNELLLGTFGQLLVYKWTDDKEDSNRPCYSFLYQQAFPNPLLALAYIDITSDGLKELLVLSSKGLHILQHNLQEAVDLCIKKLKSISRIQLKYF